MGYYIQTGGNFGKAEAIAKQYNGFIVNADSAKRAMSDPEKGVIVVLHNGLFEAAGFAYDMEEFDSFTEPRDKRPKQFVIISRADAALATGYKQ